jgi:N-acetylglucosamine kinase-like BadF-type ATPase
VELLPWTPPLQHYGHWERAEMGGVAYSVFMRFVLGFDGGGTKTDCVLMDENQQILARARGGPSNPMRVGFGGALASVCEAGRAAIRAANLTTAQIAVLCTGLAGASHPESEMKMQKLLLQEFPASAVHVCTDLDLTLEAAGDGPTVVLIMGTGSGAVGRDGNGKILRVGGHGPLLSDEGSAYDIGRIAAMQAMREFDRTQANSALGTRMLKEIGVADWPEFLSRANAIPDDVLPRIFSVVAAAAETGDGAAREILRGAAKELATLVRDLVQRLQFTEQRFSIVRSGGMVGRSSYFDQQVDACLREVAPHGEFAGLALPPAEAAARIALRLLPALNEAGN